MKLVLNGRIGRKSLQKIGLDRCVFQTGNALIGVFFKEGGCSDKNLGYQR